MHWNKHGKTENNIKDGAQCGEKEKYQNSSI